MLRPWYPKLHAGNVSGLWEGTHDSFGCSAEGTLILRGPYPTMVEDEGEKRCCLSVGSPEQ